ncbi:serine/threonine-protein kinase [Nocardioides zeae]|uniref:non-specific serine/threonine protein kinase n=1 Tax=Nocardioides imazamoxiresistens TaxID=3231893 RepID=A0ABU3PRB2_9ACTN|nr:serine/threonine-protein kinase [Nocardioides zeae]MDT9591768.1 serine/threonine-protein kinase [Nocardioides zeae]
MPTTAPPDPARPPEGLRVGPYRLLTRIGEGGMGVVHLAQRPGGPRVALKVLRPHVVGDDEARSRLAREVNSLSRVRSSRVAQIIDADPWAEIPYVATRYVPGLSLHDHVKEEGPIEGAELVRFAAELCAALDAVHRVGVLHRDVKPSNVLMEGRNPVLIDFGLARVADDPKLTHTGWLLGTPGYLAPEILYGEDAAPAADVHALASTIAYAGLGRAPFGRGPAMAVMDRVRRGQHDLDGLPDDVRAVVTRALEPDPRRRPTLAELRGWLDPSTLDASTRSRPAVGVVAAGAAAGVAASAAATTLRSPDPVATPAEPAVSPHAGTQVLPPVGDPPEGRTKVLPPFEQPTLPPPPAAREPYRQPPPPAYPARPAPQQPPRQPPPQAPQQQRPAPQPYVAPYPPAPERRSAVVRFRSGVLALGLGTVLTSCAVLAPWLTLAGTAGLVLVLRAVSLAASAGRNRRERRGQQHWSDGPRVVVATPWYLLLALPGALALVVWSVILALSAGLLALALGAGEAAILAAAGAVFALATWTGPGASRVRGPVRVATDAVARPAALWLAAVALVAAAAAGLVLVADQQGPAWSPAADAPAAPSSPQQLWDDAVDRVAFWR